MEEIIDKYVNGMDWGNEEVSFSDFKNYRKYQYDLIGDFVGENILEVGSGDRYFTKEIFQNKKHIERIYSIEPSGVLFKSYENNFKSTANVKFDCIDLFDLEIQRTGMFDTAIFIHVLEHIEEDKKALNKVADLVKPNGHVLIEVPALPFLFSVHDEILGHYRRYNKKMLRSIIDTDKYEILKIWYQDPIGVLGSFFFFKIKKIKIKSDQGLNLAQKQGGIYDKYIIPFEKQIERYITFPFGLSLTAILRRK